MRLPRSLASLRHRNARWFFVGMAVSNVGVWMQFTAMQLVVYRLTGRATDVGITLFAQFLPMLLLGAWAGAVADRRSKRVMAIATQSALALQATAVAVTELTVGLSLPSVFVLSLLQGVALAFDNPARRGYVVELVPPDEVTNVTALNTAVMTGSRLFGPGLAALLVGPLGAGWMFAINAVTFAAVLFSMVTADRSLLHPSPTANRGGRPVRDALAWVWRHRLVRVYFIVFTLIGTFAFNYSVSLLKLADRRFGDDRWIGLLLATTSVGSVVGSLAVAGQRHVGGRWLFGSAALLGGAGLAVAWAPTLLVACLASVPMGLGGAAFMTSFNAITQHECPPDMRGRVLALGAVAFLGSTPIGAPITGRVADSIGASWGLAYGSIVAIICVIWGASATSAGSRRA